MITVQEDKPKPGHCMTCGSHEIDLFNGFCLDCMAAQIHAKEVELIINPKRTG